MYAIYAWCEYVSMQKVLANDGNYYSVRVRGEHGNRSDACMKIVANKLAKVSEMCDKMVRQVQKKYPSDARTKALSQFDRTAISETPINSMLTAYNERKGANMAFCVNNTKTGGGLVDQHTLSFVAVHELAHTITTTNGHEEDFWKNFNWLLSVGKNSGIHLPRDYANNPVKYCGMTIDDSPAFSSSSKQGV